MTSLSPSASPAIENFDACFEAFKPQLGNYGWVWSILRWRARRTGFPPKRLYRLANLLFDPQKPYFRGETVDGVKFLGDCRDRYARDRMVEPNGGDPMADFIVQQMVATGGNYLDVGTNLGMVAARVALKLQGNGNVIAFEALPETAQRAAATFSLNGLHNIRLFPVALGEEDGEITFYKSPGNSDFASANPVEYQIDGIDIEWAETRVPCYRLDTLIQSDTLSRVGLLKIDVEGNELRVLRGAKALIARDRPRILFEYNFKIVSEMNWDLADITALLSDIAPYRMQVLEEEGVLRPLSSADGRTKVDIYCEPI